MYLNKVIIYGNLTRDPELKALPSGVQVATIGMATNRVFKDKNGAKQEQVEYHNVVAFGRQAEVIGQYLKRGAGLYVEGRLQTRSWDDQKSGEKKYRTEVVLDSFQFGPKGGAGGSEGGSGGGFTPRQSAAPAAPLKDEGAFGNSGSGIEYPQEDINPEDIPF
jgi:single-strand DNA-binding protein